MTTRLRERAPLWLPMFALVLSGCSAPTLAPESTMKTSPSSTATTAPTTVAPTATGPALSQSIPGEWGPAPGRIVDIAVANTTVALAEVPEKGAPMRVHLGTRIGGQWRWETPWAVPFPPTLRPTDNLTGTTASLHIEMTPEGVHLAVNRIEFQGGSHGIALASLVGGTWVHPAELPSPTDSDIAFGTPTIPRGNAVFTTEFEDRVWHYVRDGAKWIQRPLALPSGGTFTFDPPMAVRRDASEVAIALSVGKSQQLAFFRPGSRGAYLPAPSLPTPEVVCSLVYVDSFLYVGFQRPAPDGSIVWGLRPSASGSWEVAERISLPPPSDPRRAHLASLDVSNDWVLAVQPDATWVKRRLSNEPPHRLEPPAPPAGRPSQLGQARLAGAEVIVLAEDKLGVFRLK